MRIGIVETAPFGGLLHYAVQLGAALAEQGHEVDLITPRENELTDSAGKARMRDVLTPPVRSSAPPQGRGRRTVQRAGVAMRLIRAWSRIVWEATRRNYDVVVINCNLHNPVAAGGFLVLTLVPNTRIADVAHNSDALNRSSADGAVTRMTLVRALLRSAFARTDLVFVHGARSRSVFEQRWPATRLEVIPHGDERVFGEPAPPAPEERILFFGDWNAVKGLPVLMEAFDILVARRTTVRLTIAGTPLEQDVDVEAIRAWAAGHRNRVEIIDRYVPIPEVPGLFARARTVATPYVAGYQSGVIHLAMTLGRAVVTSDVGDLAAAVADGETGFVVPPRDPPALAAALETVLSDPALAARLGRAGRERILAVAGWEAVAEQASTAIASVVEEGGRSATRATPNH